MRSVSAGLVLAALMSQQSSYLTAAAPEPALPELKLLAAMIGEWDEVLTNKPSEHLPVAGRSTSITKKSWALGGKFIRMEGAWNPAKTDFVCFLTYDPATKMYRNWYFDSGGGFPRGETTGKWDDTTRTMTWTGTDEFGNKSRGVTRIIDNDHHEWIVVTKDPQGKVLLDLQGKDTRRKP